jgi:L-serine dehydratase
MSFTSGAALTALCKQNGTSISEEMIRRETELADAPRKEIISRMTHSYGVMKDAVKMALTEDITSIGGLIGGESKKLINRSQAAKPVCGSIIAKAAAYAMGVLEVNASMGLIVAAPTAGSSGVIPGTFLAVQEEFSFSDEVMVDALFNAGAIGYLITRNATVSGAEGGCQAEVGTASAMAASAVTQMMGGTPKQCLDASAMVISNLLGLVCDPVAGLVEAPCQNRNALGASTALVCAQTVLSGIGSLIPFDEMVDAMFRVGKSMPTELRETAQGGCATTPTGCQLCHKIFH